MFKGAYNNFKSNPRAKQAITLFGVNIISIPLGIITSIIITRFLGSEKYGDYMFINNVFSLAVIIGTFGFLQAGNRALVLTKSEQQAKEYYGAELFFVCAIFLAISAGMVVYALFDHNLQEKGLVQIFLLLIPFSWVFVLVNYFEVLFQADNKIKLLALSRLLPKIGFFLFAIGVLLFAGNSAKWDVALILSGFLITQIVVFVYIIIRIQPSFKNFKIRVKEIIHYNREFGFNVYIGSVFAVGFVQLSGVLIGYFSDNNAGVGYYSLALTFAGPLAMIPNIIATTNYKEFSVQKRISRKLFVSTVLLSIAALVFIWILVPFFILYFYGEEFKPVILLNFIVSIGVVFHGFADFFNRFLGAHGEGKALRNSSFIIGLSLLISNVTLIPLLGEKGAALTRLLTGIVYIICMLFYYTHLTKKLRSIKNENTFL